MTRLDQKYISSVSHRLLFSVAMLYLGFLDFRSQMWLCQDKKISQPKKHCFFGADGQLKVTQGSRSKTSPVAGEMDGHFFQSYTDTGSKSL